MTRWIQTILVILLIALLGLANGCSKADSEDAEQRVIEKKDVAEEVKERKVTLHEIDLSKIPGDIGEMDKLMLMTQEEVAARLGGYHFNAEMVFTTGGGKKKINLLERHELEQAENGDFRVRIFNDNTKNYELYWVNGEVLDRTGYGAYRTSMSTGKHLYWREKTYMALDRFYRYFRGHMKFSPAESMEYEGRPALKIAFTLDPAGAIGEADLPLQYDFPSQYALSLLSMNKMMNQNRKRVTRFEEADGYVVVDRNAGVILSYKFHGKYFISIGKKRIEKMIAAGDKNPPKEVLFILDGSLNIDKIGQIKSIEKPKNEPAAKREQPMEDVAPLLPEGVKTNKQIKAEQAKAKPENTDK